MTMISSFYNGQEDGLPPGRVGLFECECGCVQTFFASFRTRHPRYVNKTHRARAYRIRARARIAANKDWWETCDGMMEYWPLCYANALSREMERARGKMYGSW
jgi:hypothetical protein